MVKHVGIEGGPFEALLSSSSVPLVGACRGPPSALGRLHEFRCSHSHGVFHLSVYGAGRTSPR